MPRYYRAARALEEAIVDGRLPRGSKLESELHLAERLGFSPSTMPAAMRLLVDKKGLLMGRRGIGTLVAPKPVRRAVALSSLYDDPKEAGREPTSAPGHGPSAPASPRGERKIKNDADHEWLC